MANTQASYRALTYPKGKSDPEGIMSFVEDVREMAPSFRIDMERAAMANILFWLGLHWIKFDSTYRVYRPVILKKRIPRMVTNMFASIIAGTASRLGAQKPALSINPGSWDADDMASAEVGDKVRQIIEKEAHIRDMKPLAALWVLLTGNLFLVSNYDLSSRSGKDFIPYDKCLECQQVSSPVDIEEREGLCPNCGSEEATRQGLEPQFQMAVQPDGKPIGVEQPKGRHYTELKTLFETYYEYEVPMIEDSPYFIVSELQSIQWVKETYGKATADKVESDQAERDYGEYYLRSLAYTSSGSSRYISGSAQVGDPRVRVTRLWMQPGDTYPEGLYSVILGKSEVAEKMDLPYHRKDGTSFVPINHIKFDHVTGRVLGKTRADDIRPKQEQRNRIETILELHSRRMANSYWLLPDGMGVSRISGEEGHFLRYNALAGVPPPTRVPGDNPPPYLVAWLPQIDMEMADLFGSKEILRGEVPEGVSAYSAIALIDERARQQQSSLMENWTLGWMKWTRDNLDIFREYATKPRMLSLGYSAWEIGKFSNADMKSGLDIDVEPGENRPTTAIARRAALEQAATSGAFTMTDPMQQYRYLEALGIPELMEDFKMDLREAERENDMFLAGQPVPPPFPWHKHPLHMVRHSRFTNSDMFREMDPKLQGAVFEHMMLHNEFLMQQQMQLGPGQNVPAGGPGAQGNKPQGRGGSEQEVAQREAQGASPGTFEGGGI